MSNADGTIPYRLTDKSAIRSLLNTDREWSLYALADLDAIRVYERIGFRTRFSYFEGTADKVLMNV